MLTKKHMEYLQELRGEVEETQLPMNEWEIGFINDQFERLDEYGEKTFMSIKQWGIIEKVAKKYDMVSFDEYEVGKVIKEDNEEDNKEMDDEIPF